MYDIAIIGLGPAGATLARLLDKKYKVIAIDKKSKKASKCCGGLLSPDAQKILAQFDLCLPKDILADPQIFSVKTIDLDNNMERFYQRFYVNMDRLKFDGFLASLIPDNITICRGSICTGIVQTENKFAIKIKAKGKERIIESGMVIGADGASSIVRGTFYKKFKIQKYAAIQEWYKDKSTSPFYSCIFDREITNSYCWTISKDNSFIIGGAFPVKDCNNKFELLKQKVLEQGISFKKLIKREGCFVFLNQNPFSTCTGRSGAYLIGEAAGMISPSSLEGISYSMKSAKILAGIINKNSNHIGRRYFFGAMGIRFNLMLKIFKRPFMYNSFLRWLVMKSGIKAIRK